MFKNFLSQSFYNNTVEDYLIAIIIFIISMIILKIIKNVIITRLQKIAAKTKNDIDDAIINIFSNVKPPFYFLLSIYLSVQYLNLSTLANNVIKGLFILVLVYEVINAIQNVIEFVTYKALRKNDTDAGAKVTIKTLNTVVKIILWSFALILVLDNFGVNVSSLITGLGIGGVAIALALQNILGDIFASFSILIDKPFKVGDLIKIGNDMGTVEKIGIKTTRLRTLNGELLIVSNKELTNVRIQNFKQLKKRRALFTIGVTYETDPNKLKEIPKIIENIIKKEELAEFERSHFKNFGDFSLNFETSFQVDTQDYKEYRDVIEKINLAILETFNAQKIDFAYPTTLEYQKRIN